MYYHLDSFTPFALAPPCTAVPTQWWLWIEQQSITTIKFCPRVLKPLAIYQWIILPASNQHKVSLVVFSNSMRLPCYFLVCLSSVSKVKWDCYLQLIAVNTEEKYINGSRHYHDIFFHLAFQRYNDLLVSVILLPQMNVTKSQHSQNILTVLSQKYKCSCK